CRVASSAAAVGLGVAGVLFGGSGVRRADARIEATLTGDARLVAELLARDPSRTSVAALDEEANRIGTLVGARVTFIAPDGRVVGDSAETIDAIAAMDNHEARPEVMEARQTGLGRARRHSDTLKIDMLYVAVPVHHPAVAFARVALPLTDVNAEIESVLQTIVLAVVIALAGAGTIAWTISSRMSRRVVRIADVARRYRTGDLTPPMLDFGD